MIARQLITNMHHQTSFDSPITKISQKPITHNRVPSPKKQNQSKQSSKKEREREPSSRRSFPYDNWVPASSVTQSKLNRWTCRLRNVSFIFRRDIFFRLVEFIVRCGTYFDYVLNVMFSLSINKEVCDQVVLKPAFKVQTLVKYYTTS